MFNILVKIIAELFVPKHLRTNFKGKLSCLPKRIAIKLKAKSVGKNLSCAKDVYVTKYTEIGDNVHLNGLKVLGAGDAKLGNCLHAGCENLFITENHNYEGELIPYDKKGIKKGIKIGEYVWLGARVTLLPGTVIGDGAIIQAGSVVHGEIPSCAIAGGNPAKVFKYRDVEHFNKLRAEGKCW